MCSTAHSRWEDHFVEMPWAVSAFSRLRPFCLLGHHLEKQQIGQLGDVLLIGDAVLAQHGTEPPELVDEVGGGIHVRGCALEWSSGKGAETWACVLLPVG